MIYLKLKYPIHPYQREWYRYNYIFDRIEFYEENKDAWFVSSYGTFSEIQVRYKHSYEEMSFKDDKEFNNYRMAQELLK